jgi:hypothetical protein
VYLSLIIGLLTDSVGLGFPSLAEAVTSVFMVLHEETKTKRDRDISVFFILFFSVERMKRIFYL